MPLYSWSGKISTRNLALIKSMCESRAEKTVSKKKRFLQCFIFKNKWIHFLYTIALQVHTHTTNSCIYRYAQSRNPVMSVIVQTWKINVKLKTNQLHRISPCYNVHHHLIKTEKVNYKILPELNVQECEHISAKGFEKFTWLTKKITSKAIIINTYKLKTFF